jgi:hypothetical protein
MASVLQSLDHTFIFHPQAASAVLGEEHCEVGLNLLGVHCLRKLNLRLSPLECWIWYGIQ